MDNGFGLINRLDTLIDKGQAIAAQNLSDLLF